LRFPAEIKRNIVFVCNTAGMTTAGNSNEFINFVMRNIMERYLPQLDIVKRKLLKALSHLEYSYQKILKLPEDVEKLDEESLETWESFSARFGRVADIFLSKYLRLTILLDDPGFTGTLRDFVNQAEKLKMIEDANIWMAIRELRNISSHDYSESDLSAFFRQLKKECPKLLTITALLK